MGKDFSSSKSTKFSKIKIIASKIAYIDCRYKFKEGKLFINGIEVFWSFTMKRLIKYYRISNMSVNTSSV